MFNNSFNNCMPKSTVEHLQKWGKTTRIFDESMTGFGNISHAYIEEQIACTDIKVMDTDQSVKRVYKYIRNVENEYGECYPYLEMDKLALIREYGGDFVLVTFDNMADLANWVTIV